MIRKYLPVLLISFLVLLILVSQGNFVYGREVRGVTKDKIKIGLVVDHTGPLAGDIGLPITEAARIYTRHINDNGGILGRKLELIAEDDRYSIPAGIAAFKKLIYKDNILALIGPGSVGGVKALFGKIHKLKVPTLPIAPDKTMVKPFKRYIFMPFSVYGDQVGVFCDYILHDLKSKKPKITYVSFDVASGKAVLADTKEWAAFFNLDLNSEVINAGSLDATSQVMSLKIKKPTHIIIHHGVMGAVLLLVDRSYEKVCFQAFHRAGSGIEAAGKNLTGRLPCILQRAGQSVGTNTPCAEHESGFRMGHQVGGLPGLNSSHLQTTGVDHLERGDAELRHGVLYTRRSHCGVSGTGNFSSHG
ncbi:MAG: ABC transporter substrate-binding protein, partial [Spirochaetota bacterium]|nr:ABC transporter substrate-binding protein [Spirochaetota bacterium]